MNLQATQNDSNHKYNTQGDCLGDYLEHNIQITFFSDSLLFPSENTYTLMSFRIIVIV